MTPSVDVAVVAYRRWDLTRSCLEHLASADDPAPDDALRQRLR